MIFRYFECARLHFTQRVVSRWVQRRKQLAQMRCSLQNARTMPAGFLPLLIIVALFGFSSSMPATPKQFLPAQLSKFEPIYLLGVVLARGQEQKIEVQNGFEFPLDLIET